MIDIKTRLTEHYEESTRYFSSQNIVGLFLQGSQNYGLETEYSDVDTKLVVTPSLHDIIMNRAATSTTHICENEEHIDFKDIRLMLQTFRKQNLNFIEILFTDYFILNPLYEDSWKKLIAKRENIAHYNIYNNVKAMKGVALEKYYAMEHRYPSKVEIIDKFGYDPKQLHHLLRVSDFIDKYISGQPYSECMKPTNREYLIEVKLGKYTLEEARELATAILGHINDITQNYTKDSEYNRNDSAVEELLDSVQEEIMTKSIRQELN